MEWVKSSSLKLKLYIFSFFNADKLQDHQQLPVKDNKDGSFPGTPTQASILRTKRKPYNRKINHAKFCKRLEQAYQSYKKKLTKRVRKPPCPKQEGPYQVVRKAMEL